MGEQAKGAQLRAELDGTSTDLMVKTDAENVSVGGKTLAEVLTELADTLDGKEDADNKTEYYNGCDGVWGDISETTYPSTKAVYDFVASYAAQYMGEKLFEVTLAIESLKAKADAGISTLLTEWDGDVEGRTNILGTYIKVSESTQTPTTMLIDLAGLDEDGNAMDIDTMKGFGVAPFSEVDMPEEYKLLEQLGLRLYGRSGDIAVAVAIQAGALPAELVGAGADIPFEAGTYVLWQQGEIFVRRVYTNVPVKDYIDQKFEELKTLLQK